MTAMTATDAKNRFGQLLEMAQAGPVRIQKNGRDVAVVLSPEEYAQLKERASASGARPELKTLLERSMDRRRSLYEALAR